jgi:hypothetical protein
VDDLKEIRAGVAVDLRTAEFEALYLAVGVEFAAEADGAF